MKRLVIAFALALTLALGFSVPALAVDPPDSISIQSVKAWRNLYEDGDMTILFWYKMPYTGAYPTTTATDTIIFRLYAADGTTLLATATPYTMSVFETNGYGNGIGGFYLDADDAPTWGDALKINVLGLPTYFDPPQTYTYTMSASDLSSATDQDDSRLDMYNFTISLCSAFAVIYPDYSLKSATDSGTCLSLYGEIYFRGVLPGIQAICPNLFSVQTYVPEPIPTVSYNMSLGETYTSRLIGSDLMRGADRLGNHVGGISGYWVFGIAAFGGCIGLCVLTQRLGWGLEPGLVAGGVLGVGAALLLGSFLFTLVMIGSLIAAAAVMYVLFLKRA